MKALAGGGKGEDGVVEVSSLVTATARSAVESSLRVLQDQEEVTEGREHGERQQAKEAMKASQSQVWTWV